MGYVDDNLLQGERVLARAHVDPASVWAPAGITAIGGTVLGAALVLADLPDLGFLLGFVFIVVAVVLGLGGAIRMVSADFALTDRRVIAKEGLLRRRSFDVMLPKVEGIGADQGLLGRFLGYGDIRITGTGGSHEPFKSIARPYEFRSAVQARLDEIHRSG